MSLREIVYALLAVLGLAGTWYFNVQYVTTIGQGAFDPIDWLRLGFVNPAAASLTIDLLIAFLAFLVFAIAESRRIGMRHGWLYAVLACLVAFAFAFPVFLLMRERHFNRSARASRA